MVRLRGEEPERLAIIIAGASQHIRRQMGRRWFFVPTQGFQVIAHVLLVETRRTDTRLVRGHRPETGGIRRQHLVDENETPGLVDTEFEFGVRNDDLPRAGVLRRESIDIERGALDPIGIFAPYHLYHA